MISFDEAEAIVLTAAAPIGIETIDLGTAGGRLLAEPIYARLDSPRTDVSMMDGYAVQDDAPPGSEYTVVGSAYPGSPFDGALERGAAVRVFTGAAIPRGAGRVIIQENVETDNDRIRIATQPGAPLYIRRRGCDFCKGDQLLEPGQELNPRSIIAVAAADVGQVSVWRRPRVILISTGDELAEPGTASARPATIPDSLSFGVAALIELWGGDVLGRYRVGDQLDAMQALAARAILEADLVIVTGGASVGEKDFAKPAFAGVGMDLLFSKVAIMPGKPVWLGRAGDALILGLPGNPTSAMVTARLFLAPLLARLGGRDPADTMRWRLALMTDDLPVTGDRETFSRGKQTAFGVAMLRNQDSGMQRVLAEANVLIRRTPLSPALPAGGEVSILPF